MADGRRNGALIWRNGAWYVSEGSPQLELSVSDTENDDEARADIDKRADQAELSSSDSETLTADERPEHSDEDDGTDSSWSSWAGSEEDSEPDVAWPLDLTVRYADVYPKVIVQQMPQLEPVEEPRGAVYYQCQRPLYGRRVYDEDDDLDEEEDVSSEGHSEREEGPEGNDEWSSGDEGDRERSVSDEDEGRREDDVEPRKRHCSGAHFEHRRFF